MRFLYKRAAWGRVEHALLAAPESIVRARWAADTGGAYCWGGLFRTALACCAEVKSECRLACLAPWFRCGTS